jgi:transcriptional regulator with XRE-family HTH domain
MSFAERLRSERNRLGLTQAGADALLDTCKGQVATWEGGYNTPHILTQEGAMARFAAAMPAQGDVDPATYKSCRKKIGTQHAVAEKIGCTRQLISARENGKLRIKPEHLDTLQQVQLT